MARDPRAPKLQRSPRKARENVNSYRRKNPNKFGHTMGKNDQFKEDVMTEPTETLPTFAELAQAGNASAIQDLIGSQMAERVSVALDTKKVEVAGRMFEGVISETTGKKLHHKNITNDMNQAHENEFISSLRAKHGGNEQTVVKTETAKNGSPIVSHVFKKGNKKLIPVGSWDHKNAMGHYRMAEDAPVEAQLAQLAESLPASASAGDYIHDFVHSTNEKFKGKSKKERIKMALGAYYGKHPSESNK